MDDQLTVQTHLAALEAALVAEFRAHQTLVGLTREERRALILGDLTALAAVLARKEALFGELGQLEQQRETALQAWIRQTGRARADLTLADILPAVEQPLAERLRRLREGILTISTEIQSLTQTNRALVTSALEKVEAVRQFLLSLSQPFEGYHPPGSGARTSQPTVVEHWA